MTHYMYVNTYSGGLWRSIGDTGLTYYERQSVSRIAFIMPPSAKIGDDDLAVGWAEIALDSEALEWIALLETMA